jgi:multidrug efflux pump subunit AcrB
VKTLDFAAGRRSQPSVKACLLRFCPILMTTAAAMLAGLGTGIGSELRQPLG